LIGTALNPQDDRSALSQLQESEGEAAAIESST
jgi:hypothetical protein